MVSDTLKVVEDRAMSRAIENAADDARGVYIAAELAELASLREHDRLQSELITTYLDRYRTIPNGHLVVKHTVGTKRPVVIWEGRAWLLALPTITEPDGSLTGRFNTHIHAALLDDAGQTWRTHVRSYEGPQHTDLQTAWTNEDLEWTATTADASGHSDYRPSLTLLRAMLNQGLAMQHNSTAHRAVR
jgi:hypothetical protein